jgi:flagellar basal-body rod modification protein FlgD
MDTASTPAATVTTSAARPAESTASGKAIASDFDTFLRMLTVQLQNQDPLNPMESTDFAVQLATFSEVEQTQRSNQLLETITGQLGMTGMAQLANWVGLEARAPAPVWYDGTPLTLSPSPAAGADAAVLVVKNADGRVVSRQSVPVSIEPFAWDGRAEDGSALPAGRYGFDLESSRAGEVVSVTAVETYGRIVEARAGAEGTTLVLEGNIEVLSDRVTAVRKP